MTLSKDELNAHWMPFTGNRQFKESPRLMVRAKGAYYTDSEGRQIFDGLSGLWTCGLGHSRDEINEAVSKQVAELDYSPGFQYGHPLSFKLANKVIELTPSGQVQIHRQDQGLSRRQLRRCRCRWHRLQSQIVRAVRRRRSHRSHNAG